MFFKTIKIFTKPEEYVSYTKEEIKNCFSFFPKNLPSYFKSIPKNLFSTTYNTFLKNEHTIKTCPGFINFHKKSILFHSPFDIQLIFDEEKIIYASVGNNNKAIDSIIFPHSQDQFLTYIPSSKYKLIIKITFHITLFSDVSILLHNPWYHVNSLNIPPGILPGKWDNQLNIFIAIPKDQKELIIKQGDSLFMMTPITEKKIKLKFYEKSLYTPFLKTFSFARKFFTDNIKK